MILRIKNAAKIDWIITLVPLALIVILCSIFFAVPTASNDVLSKIRFFFGDTLGSYYLIIGLGIFCSQYLSLAQSMVILYLATRVRNLNIHFSIGAV